MKAGWTKGRKLRGKTKGKHPGEDVEVITYLGEDFYKVKTLTRVENKELICHQDDLEEVT